MPPSNPVLARHPPPPNVVSARSPTSCPPSTAPKCRVREDELVTAGGKEDRKRGERIRGDGEQECLRSVKTCLLRPANWPLPSPLPKQLFLRSVSNYRCGREVIMNLLPDGVIYQIVLLDTVTQVWYFFWKVNSGQTSSCLQQQKEYQQTGGSISFSLSAIQNLQMGGSINYSIIA
ncbi:hypothetical protein Zm00014a_027314 [Zea mays]|uniref:Uncharacterized protein n=1 Tax=Zea mays TaxID=4577 RepID=A0A317YG75_MAIZE|nr:hypothetical protein Zm00014a_027314 [Zea mays]